MFCLLSERLLQLYNTNYQRVNLQSSHPFLGSLLAIHTRDTNDKHGLVGWERH